MAIRVSGATGIVLAVALGLALGVGGFTFVYARGASYLTEDPAACVNCHVMRGEYDRWLASSHRTAAGCNGCHAPHDLVSKYLAKASNGFRHALAFTVGPVPDAVLLRSGSHGVANRACLTCHARMVEAIEGAHRDPTGLDCIKCHQSVGHVS